MRLNNRIRYGIFVFLFVLNVALLSAYHLRGVERVVREPVLYWVSEVYALPQKVFAHIRPVNSGTMVEPVSHSLLGGDSALPSSEFYPTRILVPAVQIDLEVVQVPLENGTWEVHPRVANYAAGTSTINLTAGNVGIYGHDRADAFAKIKNLRAGHEVMVTNDQYRAVYTVETSAVIGPDQVDVFYPGEQPILTLLTCDGQLSELRYMVQARLLRIEVL